LAAFRAFPPNYFSKCLPQDFTFKPQHTTPQPLPTKTKIENRSHGGNDNYFDLCFNGTMKPMDNGQRTTDNEFVAAAIENQAAGAPNRRASTLRPSHFSLFPIPYSTFSVPVKYRLGTGHGSFRTGYLPVTVGYGRLRKVAEASQPFPANQPALCPPAFHVIHYSLFIIH
jgi:hypothetical protein